MQVIARRGPDQCVPPPVVGDLGKRAFDLVVGTALAVVAFPVIVLLAAAVCFSFRTWRPIFLQERVGRRGRRFTVPKLRTLPPSAPVDADKYVIASVPTTRLGRFLRRTHLDELPQLLLVPPGQMSLVGPRPEMPWLLERFDERFVATRSTVRPGCSGLWQVSGDAHKLIGEAPEYDLWYIAHAGVRLDLWILWCSVLALGGRSPLVTCADVPQWALTGRHRPSRRQSPAVDDATAELALSDSVVS